MRFDIVDYIIFALLLIFSAAIGLFYGLIDKWRSNKKGADGIVIEQNKSSAKEYLLANKSMGVRRLEIGMLSVSRSLSIRLGISHGHESSGQFHVGHYHTRNTC
jgi:hypothetical protein